MPYTYPIDAQAMFEDRTDQFVSFGLAKADVMQVRKSVTDMWRNAPGGWVHEWSKLAAQYANSGEHYLASLAYGCAKFPCLTDSARTNALALQVMEYLATAPTFPLRFERRTLSLTASSGSAIGLPVHLFSTADSYSKAATLILSGGVDTWKMDIHPICVAFAQHAGVNVLAFDQPGTGETPVPLSTDADDVVLGLVRAARSLGNGKVPTWACHSAQISPR
jgi:esterase FrsA